MGRAVLSVPENDPAVTTSRVTYPSAAGNVIAYLARPKAAGPFPAVVVIHENRGLNDHIRDVARRLAKANFVALAPDLTSRAGSTEMLDPDMARMYLSNAEPADLVADLSAGVDFALSQPGIRPPARWAWSASAWAAATRCGWRPPTRRWAPPSRITARRRCPST